MNLSGRRHNVPRWIHAVVQNPKDFDDSDVASAIQNEVAAAPSIASNVQCTQFRQNFIAGRAARKEWAAVECCERGDEGAAIDQCLSVAEVGSGPPDDFAKVRLGRLRKANAPRRRTRTLAGANGATEALIADRVQMRLK
jgi:hypothetical protein